MKELLVPCAFYKMDFFAQKADGAKVKGNH